MASAGMIYRNYNSTDTTSQGLTIPELPQPPASWEREGYFFKEWNTSRDGSGASYQPGDGIPITGEAYAIWYGDYIEAIKDSSGIEHPIKDTVSGYITSYTETDPTVPAWAKAASKPTYTASEVGALPDSTDLSVYMQKGVDYVTAGQRSGTTLGTKATAEGFNTTSSNNYTHAEGSYTVASGSAAHAEGNWTQASGSSAHAEGQNTTAEGSFSHAEGNYTVAHNKAQHVFGEFNVAENKMSSAYRGTYVEIVGNGTADTARSNARTLDWSGNETLAGKLTVGTGPTNAMDVATKQYVDTGISNIAFPVTSVNGQTGAVTTAEKFVITATAISGTNYYNLDKTFADINVAIGDNKYVTIEDIDMTYPYTTTVSQGVVFGATLIATGEGNQLLAITDGILVVPPDSGTNAMGIAVHSSTVLPTMSDIPSASSTTPSMDGTAAVGIGTTWARADHVHPTDTSRQAVLVSGTNIKTINNESILGSGNISISAGSSDVFIAEYGVTTYADILAAYEAGKAIFCQKIASSSLNNTKIVSILPLAYIGSSDQTASASRKAIFKNMSGNYSLDQTNITSWTVSGVSGQWSSENIETDTSDQGILSINKSGNSTYLYSNTVNGIVKDDGTGVLSAAVAGTDYQAPLVSGTNIKTINNESLLGSGNISISGGSSNIFIATYQQTTYNEVAQAWSAGKDIIAFVDVGLNYVAPYYLTRVGDQGTYHIFRFVRMNKNEGATTTYACVELTNSGWSSNVTTVSLAELSSPTFTGTPKAPTATAGTNTTQIATTAFVQGEKKNLVVDGDSSLDISSLADLKTQLSTWYATIEDCSTAFFWFHVPTAFSLLTQGDKLVRLQRATSTWGFAEIFADFGSSGSTQRMRYFSRSDIYMNLGSGTWFDPVLIRATLGNYYDYANRPTDADTAVPFVQCDGGLYSFKATGSMTSNKPVSDGHIIHDTWDYTGNYSTQLFLPNATTNGTSDNGNRHVQVRGCYNGTWKSWESLAWMSDVTDAINTAIGSAILASY